MSVRLFNAAESYYFLTNTVVYAFLGPQKNGGQEPVVINFTAVLLAVGVLLEKYIDIKKQGR